MAKGKISINQDLDNPLAGEGRSYGKGFFVGLLVLSVVGLALWFLVYNHESH